MAVPGPLLDKCSLCRGLWHLQSDVTRSQHTGSVSPAPAWLSLASPGSCTGWHEMNLGHSSWDGEGSHGWVTLVGCLGRLSEGCRWGTRCCPHPAMPHWDRVCAREDARGRQGAARAGSPAGMHSLLLCSWHRACPSWEGTGGRGEARAALPAAWPGAFPPAQEEGVCRQWKHRVFS